MKQLAEAISKVKDANYKEAGERRALESGLRQVRAELEAARLREGELEVQLKHVADSIKVMGVGVGLVGVMTSVHACQLAGG